MKEVWLLAHEQQSAGKMYSWTVICWQLAWLRRQAAKPPSGSRIAGGGGPSAPPGERRFASDSAVSNRRPAPRPPSPRRQKR